MSQPSALPPPPPPAHQRDGCLTAILIVVGLILLLPGVCGIILVANDMKEITRDGTVLAITAALLGVGACGIVVIWIAVRPRR